MYKHPRIITRTTGSILFLCLLILTLAGCGGREPEPPEVATAVPPVVTIVMNPAITQVTPSQQVILSIEATGSNLEVTWSSTRGTVSSPEGPSTIYTTPNDAGPDTVSATVTSDAGTTTKVINFTVLDTSTDPSLPSGTANITLSIDGTTALGQVSGLDSAQYGEYKVLVYLQTDKAYIQPGIGGSAIIEADGSWQMDGLHIIPGVPTTAYAYLARGDYQAPSESPQEPRIDGFNIIVKGESVKVQ